MSFSEEITSVILFIEKNIFCLGNIRWPRHHKTKLLKNKNDTKVCQYHSSVGRLKTGGCIICVLWWVLCKGRESLPVVSASAPVHTAQEALGLHCCQGHCWLMVSLLPTNPHGLLHRAAPSRAESACAGVRDFPEFRKVGPFIQPV